MANVSTGSTTIPFGATLRIGYRIFGGTDPFTYLSYFPSYNELPYVFTLPTTGIWEIEYTTICPNCSMPNYSNAASTTVTVT